MAIPQGGVENDREGMKTMEVQKLSAAIVAHLRSHPDQTAREIAAALAVDKSEV